MFQKKYANLLSKQFIKKNAPIECLVGEYYIIGSPIIKSFELRPENIVKVPKKHRHKLGGCCAGITDDTRGINVYRRDILTLHPLFLPCFPDHLHIYTFVLHANGVVRFVINLKLPLIYKLMFAYYDSEGFIDLVKNLHHRNNNGCFCFGLLTHEDNLVRYNRWNEDCVFFAMIIKIHD